ncbi:TPA: hypothetical protein KNI17_002317 [Clostridioides difficile]|nr:hypothetical protein [Clostridioides difficile]
MDIYLGIIKRNKNFIGVVGIFTESGQFYKGYKKYINKEKDIYERYISLYIWSLHKVRLLYQNSKLDICYFNIFIDKLFVYKYINKEYYSKIYKDIFKDLILEISLLPIETTIIYKNNINNKLSRIYNLLNVKEYYLNIEDILNNK